MARPFSFGYSSCPNDTFMLDALVHGKGPLAGTAAPHSWVADIAALNQRAIHGPEPLDFTKMSVAAFAHCSDRYQVMRAGAALGRGVGPLVLFNPKRTPQLGEQGASLSQLQGRKVAIPGAFTTANLLLAIFGPHKFERVPMRFDQIVQALLDGQVEAGLVIHETRFVYPSFGLACLADLGELWEQDTQLPLPLGVMVGKRDLGAAQLQAMAQNLSSSVRHALDHPGDSASFVAQHAKEMSPTVCKAHIELYVNEYSVDLGLEGQAALSALMRRGRAAGCLPTLNAEDGDAISVL